ncbi:hypothetical protein [Pseudopontixanthobacter vadosimaris]|uniref:hypothetical protein n=1 Tax=Pseudopontixanthobacter vadosimaris TaxID=2726450 RepID=UPI0014748ADD|nr:hypothetical protein [Pseudopontixanthobacter vadosimaris]
MPTSDFAVAFVLAAGVAACGNPPTQAQADPGARAIECSLDGGGMTSECQVETVTVANGKYLIIRHPGGGFRRMEEARDGRGLVSADGAGELERLLDGDILEVAVDGDRYRFPATRNGADDAD